MHGAESETTASLENSRKLGVNKRKLFRTFRPGLSNLFWFTGHIQPNINDQLE